MFWLAALLTLLSLAIQWLMRQGYLTTEQQAKLNRVIARARRLEYEAVKRGCKPGGDDDSTD